LPEPHGLHARVEGTDDDTDAGPPPWTRRWWFALAAVVVVPVLDNLAAIVRIVHYEPQSLTSYASVISHKGFVPGVPYGDPYVGFVSQALGHVAAMDWLHGRLPWWNLNEGLGMPLAASTQTASFFPLTLVQALPDGSLWFHLGIELIAGVACLLLLRELRCSPFSSAVGAIAFSLDGSMAWLTNAVINPIPFLPMCLLGVEHVVRHAHAHRRAGWIVLACGVGLSLIAGFPEMAAVSMGLIAAWFLVRLIQQRRVAFGILWRTVLGIVVGLLLAVPMLNTFLPYLANGYVGPHNQDLAARTLNPAGLSQLVAPYLFGSKILVGGYTGVVLLVLSIGALAGRKERVLRWLLAAWPILFIGSAFGVPVLHQIVEDIPGLTHIAIYRYAIPSSLFAMCLLAAMCLDDLRGLRFVALTRRMLPGLVAAVALFVFGFYSVPRRYGWVHHSGWYWVSPALFLATLLAVVVAVRLVRLRWRSAAPYLLGVLLVVETFGFFAATILSWPRTVTYDTSAVQYLRSNLGTRRFFTVLPIGPDYGSYYAIAQLDAADLPVPANWATYVHSQLNSKITPSEFGNQGPPGQLELLAGAIEHLPTYEADGVAYLVVGLHTNLDSYLQPRHVSGSPTPNGGRDVQLALAAPSFLPGALLDGFTIPTPSAVPQGLRITACSAGTCVRGLVHSTHGQRRTVRLQRALTLGQHLNITLTVPRTQTLSILTAASAPRSPVGVIVDGLRLHRRSPLMTLVYATKSLPVLVATTSTARIYRLADSSPVATAPGCAIKAHSMTTFTATCSKPSTMLYRELSYEGWSASVGGRAVPIRTVDGVFQSVHLPAGASSVTFSYEPPHAMLAWLGTLAGLLAICVGFVRRRRPRTRAEDPADHVGHQPERDHLVHGPQEAPT
jgi:hypothetical protein